MNKEEGTERNEGTMCVCMSSPDERVGRAWGKGVDGIRVFFLERLMIWLTVRNLVKQTLTTRVCKRKLSNSL